MYARLAFIVAIAALASFGGSDASAQAPQTPAPLPAGQTNDPFPQPIARDEGVFVTAEGTPPRPLLAIIQEKKSAHGKTAAIRADMRFYTNAAEQIFLLNKADGMVRLIEK